jgi:hypothetical protein
MPAIDGGTVGDLTIAAHRWHVRPLQARALVAAKRPTGRRARGASVPPDLSQIGRDSVPSLLLKREEKGRGLPSSDDGRDLATCSSLENVYLGLSE